ncbi:MAG TPA: acyloxyacyl hydrolase [Gemmataceae bacterium]|nr:acyloxyacyl hydrolase [Gemmataceae bacterium]
MFRRRRIALLAVVALATPTGVLAQGYNRSGVAPPIPTGKPLTPIPGADTRPPLYEDDAVLPASAQELAAPTPTEMPPGTANPIVPQPWHPTPPPAGYASSACNFNTSCSEGIFSPGATSVQVVAGVYSSVKLGPTIPTFTYYPVSIRHGYMLTAPSDTDSKWRGNWEFLCDLTVAAITSHYGHYLVGPSFFLRHNFVQPDAVVVPYGQLGAGFLLNDAHQDETQSAIGSFFEFYLHAEIGLKYFVCKNLSLDIEGGFQHISNARLADRNLGVNAMGAQVGFTYYFGAEQ